MLSRQLHGQREISVRILQAGRAFATKGAAGLDATPLDQAKPYSEIPGPSRFNFIRSFLPGGRYSNKPVHKMFLDMNKRFGDIFRMPGIAGKENMDHFKRVHRRDIFDGADGLTSGNGPAWGKLRTAVNPILLQPRNAKLYVNNILQVNDELLERIRAIRDPKTQEMPAAFVEEIRRLVLVSICSVALSTLAENLESEEAKQMIKALANIVELSFLLPLIWKYLPVPMFKTLMRSLDTIAEFCYNHIQQALKRIEEDARDGRLSTKPGMETSILEKLARSNRQTDVIIALGLLFAGVDPTLVSLTGILLSLSKNPAQQARLLKEIRGVLLEKNSPLSIENMKHLPHLRACIKEGIRMSWRFGVIGAGLLIETSGP
ncbi:probable cytochrome P450 12e1, mitochondrial [Drosophila grimshawi]|uniref:probable cytochrome P450 12e1, mitochondrial n=1 Tax=Drosophila grimshawi TaxID=7222 RepID=UPI0013EF2AED|nr:probable cytochrome P450 12e1, mitochondrial [Drosophila grimshawi]